MSEFYTAEDFRKTFSPPLGDDDLEFIANAANAKLREWATNEGDFGMEYVITTILREEIAELKALYESNKGLHRLPWCGPEDQPELNSRSQMRRLAVQAPDELIKEIERLRAERDDWKKRLAPQLYTELKAARDDFKAIHDGPHFKRERLDVTDWAEAYEQASDIADAALTRIDEFLGRGKG